MVDSNKLIAHTISSDVGELPNLKNQENKKNGWQSTKPRETSKNPSKSHLYNTFGDILSCSKSFLFLVEQILINSAHYLYVGLINGNTNFTKS